MAKERTDTERLDWLETVPDSIRLLRASGALLELTRGGTASGRGAKDIRSAIDAAMDAEEGR